MSKTDLIQRIQSHNASAATAFLEAFEAGELEAYLERLDRLANKRGRGTQWTRAAGAAVTGRAVEPGDDGLAKAA